MRACFDETADQAVNYQGPYFRISAKTAFGGSKPGPVPTLHFKVMEVEEMNTAGETCDAVTLGQMTPYSFYLGRGGDRLREGAHAGKRDPQMVDICKMVVTLVSDDSQSAVDRLKGYIAKSIGSKTFDYRRMAEESGFEQEAGLISARLQAGDEVGATNAVTEKMWRAYGIAGNTAEVREQVAAYAGKVQRLILLSSMHGLTSIEEYVESNWNMLEVVSSV